LVCAAGSANTSRQGGRVLVQGRLSILSERTLRQGLEVQVAGGHAVLLAITHDVTRRKKSNFDSNQADESGHKTDGFRVAKYESDTPGQAVKYWRRDML
jgi:hypothetical protein